MPAAKKPSTIKAVAKKKKVTKSSSSVKKTTKKAVKTTKKPAAKKLKAKKNTTKTASTVKKSTKTKKIISKKKSNTKKVAATKSARPSTKKKSTPVAQKVTKKDIKTTNKSVSKKTSVKKASVTSTWKDDSLLYYPFNFLKVATALIFFRAITTFVLSWYVKLDWAIDYFLGKIPYISFSGSSGGLSIKINTYSQVLTTLFIVICLVISLYKKSDTKTKQGLARYTIRANAWLLGVFAALVSFIMTLVLRNLHIQTNSNGLIAIAPLVLFAVVLYFTKMNSINTK